MDTKLINSLILLQKEYNYKLLELNIIISKIKKDENS